MLDVAIVGVTGTLFIAASWLMHHIIMTFNRKNLEITRGVSQGEPMLPEMRLRTLWQVQAPTVVLVVAFSLVMAFAFWTIGGLAADANVHFLCQACAWFYTAFSAVWLVTGPLAIAAVSRMLRRSETG